MYEAIISNLKQNNLSKKIKEIERNGVHLGIFTNPYLDLMLQGKKTIESRFSKNKIAPYQKIAPKDTVFIKESGGPIVGFFTVKEVLFFDLKQIDIRDIKEKYNERILATEDFWRQKESSNYATLLKIENLTSIKPFKIDKKGMQTWIKLK